MPTYKNMSQALEYIQKAINKSLQNEVKDAVAKTMDEKIDEVVYSSYSPTMYDRRGELGNIDNIVGEVVSNGVLEVKNIAQPSPSVLGGQYDQAVRYGVYGEDMSLTDWVVNGKVPNIFNGNDYPWMHERDFIEATREELKKSAIIESALAKGLRKYNLTLTNVSGITIK